MASNQSVKRLDARSVRSDSDGGYGVPASAGGNVQFPVAENIGQPAQFVSSTG